MFVKLISASGFLVLISNLAIADQQSYCAAYATDFANAQAKDKPLWQHKYEIALQSCITVSNSVIVEAAPIQKSVKKPLPVVQLSAKIVPPEPTLTKPRLKSGPDDRNAYCSKKYASFNVKTGMYRSLKGVDRKCVMTKP